MGSVPLIRDRSEPQAWPQRDWRRHRLALVVDPRFSGGTSVAVAAEIRALAGVVDLRVFALETAMFQGRQVHPAIEAACEAHGIAVSWDASVIRADTIVLHNPSSLRFNRALPVRMSAGQAFVVTHENFLRPGGAEGFDVARCLDLLERALICGRRALAPVSCHNRRTVEDWLAPRCSGWRVTPDDWFNIVDFTPHPPTAAPRDRRGRHSRPGPEKFPPIEALARQFPPHAEACIILGGDGLLLEREGLPRHWDVRPFGATAVERFFEEIDFFVYFTNPRWRESFGRAVAEAIAAGKLVIADPGTAEGFGPAVVASDGTDVDRIVAELIAEPARYQAFVRAAQAWLAGLGAEAFRAMALTQIEAAEASFDALV